jgi:hypothetical protein
MAGTKRKSQRSRKLNPRLRYGRRRGRFGKLRKRFRRGGSRRLISKLFKKVKKVAKRVSTMPHLEVRKYQREFSGNSVGAANNWMYRVVDNMFNFVTGSPATVYNDNQGWNFFYPLASAISAIYGTGPLEDTRYYFIDRKMSTLFQAPTNTPTFVEVYLLKPKFRGVMSSQYNPLVQGLQGTTGNTTGNPIVSSTPYNYVAGQAGAETSNSYAYSDLNYNPFYDRPNMKDRFKIVKRWKFVLGPASSKVITLRSKKRFAFKPSLYSASATGTTDIQGNVISSFVDVTPSSRVMVARWHGFNCIDPTNQDTDVWQSATQPRAGLTGDPLLVRRWFDFKLYKEDVTVPVTALLTSTEHTTTKANIGNVRAFGFDATVGTVPAQPGAVGGP